MFIVTLGFVWIVACSLIGVRISGFPGFPCMCRLKGGGVFIVFCYFEFLIGVLSSFRFAVFSDFWVFRCFQVFSRRVNLGRRSLFWWD